MFCFYCVYLNWALQSSCVSYIYFWVSEGRFYPAILWIATQCVMNKSRSSDRKLKVNSGFVCILSCGSFSSCKVHSFMSFKWLFVSRVSRNQSTREGMEMWCFFFFPCAWKQTAGQYFTCFINVCLCCVHSSARWDAQLLSTVCAVCHLLQTKR